MFSKSSDKAAKEAYDAEVARLADQERIRRESARRVTIGPDELSIYDRDAVQRHTDAARDRLGIPHK